VAQAGRRVVGETPVEADGSFHAQVPAATPLQLQLLDRDGLAMASSGWLWVPYKGRQGCVGCHEDGELVPANRFVDALTRPATVLLQPPAERRTVDFRHDLAPVVAARCVACHGARANVRLDATDAYDTLLTGVAATVDRAVAGRWVIPGSARTSPLIWHLLGRTPDGVAAPATVPPRPEALTADELRRFVEWVDLGAAWDAREMPEGGPP
jgi:mono/diheme cytochrome c family protein